ncbi:hypothetical protein [Haloglycomyces albus]|uniref:hypothetical protein n=1 Tax=Haloglycomyces albus TaxID=526067 RepID=UPI00046CF370|nr:hypothetical protein [Haloglycomyces albus]
MLWTVAGILGGTAAIVAVLALISIGLSVAVKNPNDPYEANTDVSALGAEEDLNIHRYEIGDCIPFGPVWNGAKFEPSIPCDGDDAFYRLEDKVDLKGSGYHDTSEQEIVAAAEEACGAEYDRYVPGEAWRDSFLISGAETGEIETVLCLRALDKPDADGFTPIYPDAGDCIERDMDMWGYSVSCESEAAYAQVDRFIQLPEVIDRFDELLDDYTDSCEDAHFSLPVHGDDIEQVMCITEM